MIAGPIEDTTMRLPSGRALAFTTWGDPGGGVVFYLHGTGHSRLFCPDPEGTLRAGVHLIASDRPGVGGSDPHRGHTLEGGARDLVDLADHLGIERFGVVDDWIRRLARPIVTLWPDVGHLGVARRWVEVVAAIHPERCSPRTR